MCNYFMVGCMPSNITLPSCPTRTTTENLFYYRVLTPSSSGYESAETGNFIFSAT